MQAQKNTSSTKKASRKVSGSPVAKKAVTPVPVPPVPETFTPLGDAIRKSGPYGEMLVDGIEGLAYYQKAKRHISDLFINYMAFNDEGEMSEEYKHLHVALHTSIQALLDNIHREYVYGIREKGMREYEEILSKINTENFA